MNHLQGFTCDHPWCNDGSQVDVLAVSFRYPPSFLIDPKAQSLFQKVRLDFDVRIGPYPALRCHHLSPHPYGLFSTYDRSIKVYGVRLHPPSLTQFVICLLVLLHNTDLEGPKAIDLDSKRQDT